MIPHSYFHFFRLRVFLGWLPNPAMEMLKKQFWMLQRHSPTNPGTTNGTQFDILQSMFLPFFGEMCFLTAGPVGRVPVILAELPEQKNRVCFFKKHHRHE